MLHWNRHDMHRTLDFFRFSHAVTTTVINSTIAAAPQLPNSPRTDRGVPFGSGGGGRATAP